MSVALRVSARLSDQGYVPVGNLPKSAQDACVNRNPDQIHLDELLDAALAGTFPASDPVSGLVHDRTKPPIAEAPAEGAPPHDKDAVRTTRS
jgi:hypothetical protein